ncbi:MAG TPA: phosphoketolase family protein [bacterium]|nr:phosphoketolase family protein [bacterium]
MFFQDNHRKLISAQKKYFRLVNYISAAQLYLKDNFLLETQLKKEHIKDRILGHWGTVPGLNFIYMNLNRLIKKYKQEIMLINGPGHGYPSLLSNLYLEGSLGHFYPEYQVGKESIGKLIKNFSWPGGFPSHANPETPGVILEGGELGYALSTAFGAAFDNPNLIVACVVGDGEAETGPTATAWHSTKFLNPKTDGVVLPIVHINKYKISGPTIYGTMSNEELDHLFKGYGYTPIFVEESGIFENMIDTTEKAYQLIKEIKKSPPEKPKWPVILMKSMKGWTGPHESKGIIIEDSFRSHGIPLEKPKSDPLELDLLEKWLESYKIEELLDKNFQPIKEIKKLIPKKDMRIGMNKHANNLVSRPLNLPKIENYELRSRIKSGTNNKSLTASSTAELSKYLRDIIKENPDNFRIMSPDETESNKLHPLFEVTKRRYIWPVPKESENISPDGRIMEMLSEHTLEGWMQGYVLTGRNALFISYEAFMMIIASMVDQYSKFLKQSKDIKWRRSLPSLNFLLTSTSWRQDHNGYSHQNPGFISSTLNDYTESTNIYFPPDANTLLAATERALQSENKINIIIAGKRHIPQHLSLKKAREQTSHGLLWWKGKGTNDKDPDIVFAASGDYSTLESISAIKILKKLLPEVNTRFVSVSEITSFGVGDNCRKCRADKSLLTRTFTKDKPVLYSYHGYPEDIKSLLYNHEFANRFHIFGYQEKGTTTTPFDMQVANSCSRLHLVLKALELLRSSKKLKKKLEKTESYMQELLKKHHLETKETGMDIDEIRNFDKYY